MKKAETKDRMYKESSKYNELTGLRRYRIYAAGKISGRNWRRDIVPDEGYYLEPDHRFDWPIKPNVVVEGHSYTGPYFLRPETTGLSQPMAHGLVSYTELGNPAPNMSLWIENPDKAQSLEDEQSKVWQERVQISELCLGAIRRAQIVFVWLDSPLAYGTMAEIGYASALKKRIVMGIAPGFDQNQDLWLVQTMADWRQIDELPSNVLAAALTQFHYDDEEKDEHRNSPNENFGRIESDPIVQKWRYDPRKTREYPGNLGAATERQINYLQSLAQRHPEIAKDMLHIVKLEFGEEATFASCNKAVATFVIDALTGKRTR